MISFSQRDSKVWTAAETDTIGPGAYENSGVSPRECHNHGAVPFGGCGERFKSELAMKFEALPGPGHYQEFQVPKKKQNSSFISSTSRYSNPRSRPSMLRPNIDELSITSTVDDSKLRLFSSDNIEHNNSPKKKRLIRTRNNPSLSHSKTAISIPFKKEDDNSNSVGPGYYEPNISAVHKKVPYTKIMKDTLHNRQGNINFVRRIVKTVSKPKNPAVHEQIATHKLDNENAVFSSRTSRNPDIKPTPGPGLYNSEFDHTYVKNLPEGFGSTTEREYLMNRNIFEAPFSDPTSTFNPGVGTYNRRRKHRKEHSENKIKKMQDSLNQNRAMTLANAKLLNKDRSINESKNQKADPPGPGQYDCGFREELKMLDHKLSARYKKVPFGSSSKRFKLEKCQENIKKNRKITLRNTNFNTSNDTNESILQQKKNRNKQVTERIKQINKVKPSHMFKSQSQRLENPKKNYHSSERRFQADVLKNNIFS
ncbi:unnamed protein product [Moneuplotes crassus]|uniref:Uncharacterized protein n=1 Tax=Euplotes crassus TaxID=5936 RepID=A0AAD1X6L5_EUPCR|nr:unnamed protein product [Moneuplotes crassus]